MRITNFHYQAAASASTLSVRVAHEDGTTWFVAADVCAALGIGNPSDALGRLDADERTLVSIEGAPNGLPVNLISEPGLYSLILGSRKPEAKPFKRWVTHVVLPQIASTGVFIDRHGHMAEALDHATHGRIKLDQDDPARTANLADMAGIYAAIAATNDTVAKLAKELGLQGQAANRVNRDMRRDFSRTIAQLVRVNKAQRASNAGADPNRPLNEEEIERAKFLFASGESAKQIAKRLNRTYGAMARFIAENPALVVAAVQRPLL